MSCNKLTNEGQTVLDLRWVFSLLQFEQENLTPDVKRSLLLDLCEALMIRMVIVSSLPEVPYH